MNAASGRAAMDHAWLSQAARDHARLSQAARDHARLIVRSGQSRHAIPMGQVREIVAMPRLTRVPLGPPLLLGLGAVRGETLAILATDAIAALPRQLLVLEGRDRVGLAVDAVERLERRGSDVADFPLESWIADAFPVRPAAKRGSAVRRSEASRKDDRVALLQFSVAGQSFALPVGQVAEVVAVPGSIATMPSADAAALGTMLWRDRTLGVLHLSVLLGFGGREARDSRAQKIVVATIGGDCVGLLVDGLHGLRRIARERFDPVPHSLQHAGSEATIDAICRSDDGRLVSVLSTDHLLSEARGKSLPVRREMTARAEAHGETLSVLRIAIGEYHLALALAMVEQVAHVPQNLTAVPGSPAWLAGLAHLGGGTIAVVDQVLRLTGKPCAGARRRMIVVRARGERVGFLFDDSPGIMHVDRAGAAPAPLPAALASGIYGEVLRCGAADDMLLLLDPAAMIASAEQDLLPRHTSADRP